MKQKYKTVIAIPGGGLVAAAFAFGVLSSLIRRNLIKPANCVFVGCSGGALAAYLLSKFNPFDSYVAIRKFAKTSDAYKLNPFYRLFGWFFIKNGAYDYQKFIKALEPTKSMRAIRPAAVEVIDTSKSWTPEVIEDPGLQDVVNSMSILGLVELTGGDKVDPGLVNVVPIEAIKRLADKGAKIIVIDGAHRPPEFFHASKNKFIDNVGKLPEITAWNTYENDIQQLLIEGLSAANAWEVKVIESTIRLKFSEFSIPAVMDAYTHGQTVGEKIVI